MVLVQPVDCKPMTSTSLSSVRGWCAEGRGLSPLVDVQGSAVGLNVLVLWSARKACRAQVIADRLQVLATLFLAYKAIRTEASRGSKIEASLGSRASPASPSYAWHLQALL